MPVRADVSVELPHPQQEQQPGPAAIPAGVGGAAASPDPLAGLSRNDAEAILKLQTVVDVDLPGLAALWMNSHNAWTAMKPLLDHRDSVLTTIQNTTNCEDVCKVVDEFALKCGVSKGMVKEFVEWARKRYRDYISKVPNAADGLPEEACARLREEVSNRYTCIHEESTRRLANELAHQDRVWHAVTVIFLFLEIAEQWDKLGSNSVQLQQLRVDLDVFKNLQLPIITAFIAGKRGAQVVTAQLDLAEATLKGYQSRLTSTNNDACHAGLAAGVRCLKSVLSLARIAGVVQNWVQLSHDSKMMVGAQAVGYGANALFGGATMVRAARQIVEVREMRKSVEKHRLEVLRAQLMLQFSPGE